MPFQNIINFFLKYVSQKRHFKVFVMKTILLLAFLSFSFSLENFAQKTEKKVPQRSKTEPFRISHGKSFSASAPQSYRIRTDNSAETNRNIISRDFSDALKIIKNFYVIGNKIDYNEIVKTSISSMLHALDPHSNYFDPAEYKELLSSQRSEYSGIGAIIESFQRKGKDHIYVISTFPNSPAYQATLRFGDRIVAVNGEYVIGKSSLHVRDQLRGRKGTSVHLKVERADTKLIEKIVLKRERIVQPSIQDAYMLRRGIGYIDLSGGFNYSTNHELSATLKYLQRQGMTSLILDLRDNPGGILEQAVRTAEKFLSYGKVIVTQRGRFLVDNLTWKSRNKSPINYPLIVIVNGESASASEIVAGTLQDHDRALIVGEKTFGKGLVQNVIDLPFGSGLTLTTAKYYTPSGRLIQRDYSTGSLYDYYKHETIFSNKTKKIPMKKTANGRTVYSSDGITPDEIVKSPEMTETQKKLWDPIFFFSRDLAYGRVPDFENYRIKPQINIDKRINTKDFPVTRELISRFKNFVKSEDYVNISSTEIDAEIDFILNEVNYNIASAAYGSIIARQVLIENDVHVNRAISMLPKARQLAKLAFKRRRKSSRK